jgi:hypothetical protein
MVAGGVAASRIAKWNGQTWSAVGTGLSGGVSVLKVFDGGGSSGPALYAGGAFQLAGGAPARHVAKWDGQSWTALGLGTSQSIEALSVFDDGSGSGPALYAGGLFTLAGGAPANYIAKWDGQTWSALGSGLGQFVLALTVFEDGSGSGPALIAAGQFAVSPGGDSYVAKWGCDAPTPGFAVTMESSGGSTATGLSVVPAWDGERIVPRFLLEPSDAFRHGLLLFSDPAASLSLGQCGAATNGLLTPISGQWIAMPLSGAQGVTLSTAARRYLFGREVQVQAVYTDGMDSAVRTSNALRIRLER